MSAKPRTEALGAIHETMQALHQIGAVGVNGVFYYHISLPLSPFLSLIQLLFLFPFIDIRLILRTTLSATTHVQ